MTQNPEPPVSPEAPFLEKYKYIVFLVIAVALGAGVIMLLIGRPDPTTITIIPPEPTRTPSATPIPSATPTPGPYTVYITGAVASPEIVVTLDHGSRVLHALDAAGGPRPDADLGRVNLAQRVADGDQINVPTRVPGSEAPPTPAVRIITATPGLISVYVTGEVAQPQTLTDLPAGSQVGDAIEAAGGATGNADLSRVNLGQQLNDGDMVYVPPLVGEGIQTPTPNRPVLIHVNTATLAELETLPNIGPSLAQAIIDYRTQNGPFRRLEDLDNVPGIGPATLEAIRDQVVFD